MTHLGQPVLFRGYTSGLATAVLLVLPYGFGLGRRLDADGLLSVGSWARFVALGVVLQVPIIAATMLIAQG